MQECSFKKVDAFHKKEYNSDKIMVTYFANYINELCHSGKSKSNTHQKKILIEGELKVKRYNSNGKMFVRLSAEFPISSEDIANGVDIAGIFEGTARVQFLENEIRIEKVDDTLLGGNYEDVHIIQYRDHVEPYDGNHTTSSSSSSQDDIATIGGNFSPMEIDTESRSENLLRRFRRLVKKN